MRERHRQVKHTSLERRRGARALPGDTVIMPGGVSEEGAGRIHNIEE